MERQITSKIFKNNIRNLKILLFMSCQFGLFLRFFTFLTSFEKVVRLGGANLPHSSGAAQ